MIGSSGENAGERERAVSTHARTRTLSRDVPRVDDLQIDSCGLRDTKAGSVLDIIACLPFLLRGEFMEPAVAIRALRSNCNDDPRSTTPPRCC